MNDFIRIFFSIIITGIVTGGFFIYLFFNLDKLEKSIRIILRILAFLVPIIKIRNKYIAVSIQNQINILCEEIEKKAPGVMPAALKIEFVKAKNIPNLSERIENKIIVRLNFDRSRDKLFATTAYLYINRGFLDKAKYYIEDITRKSIDFSVTKRLLKAGKSDTSLTYFLDNYVEPEVRAHPEIRQLCYKIDYLDEDGFFYEVFVRVMLKIGEDMYPNIATEDALEETKNFLESLYIIASKLQRQKVPLSFKGKYIKVGIILVMEEEVYEKYGAKPYIDRYISSMEEGIDIIFFKGIGETNIDITRKVVESLNRKKYIQYFKEILRPIKIRESVYKRAIYVYTLPDKNAIEFEYDKNTKEISAILEREIPAIKNGEIEILKIARKKGYLTKVLVKSKVPYKNAANLCLGENLEYLKKVIRYLDKETIEFINYDNNISIMIKNALFTLYAHSVYCRAVNIDGFNKYDIFVSDEHAFRYALEHNALHKKLVDNLLGISSYIKINNIKKR